jgi:pyridoxamine 5'-phosphate oxidase
VKQKLQKGSALRKPGNSLSADNVAPDPIIQFTVWFAEAATSVLKDVNAMCLATADQQGRPSARIVLLREVDWRGIVFYSNYESRKGTEMKTNPFVAATFHWKELDRQVRFTGKVRKTSRKESEAYFNTRPLESRISAAISPQSRVIPGRSYLEKKKAELLKSLSDPGTVPCPEYWGGYRLEPNEVEFWQGREHRLHDRIVYTKKGKKWIIRQLAP